MKLKRQAFLSLANTVSSAVALLLVFRLGFQYAGTDRVGLWALLSGLLMFARIADTGASLAISRQLVIDRAEGAAMIGSHLWAGLTIASLPALMLGLLICGGAYVVLSGEPTADPFVLAAAIAASLMYAVGNSLAGVLSGCLDGGGLMGRRYAAGVVSNVALIGMAVLAIPRYGFAGFLAVQIGYVGLLSILYVVVVVSGLGVPRSTFDDYKRVLRMCYAFVSQSILLGTARAGFEPVSKFLILHFGGLGAVAVFDLANRISTQLRQMVNAPLQPIAVMTARTTPRLGQDMQRPVERWMLLCVGIGLLAALLQILTSPLVSRFILLQETTQFVLVSATLAIGFFVNFSGTVAYYVVMASGRLRELVLIHLGMVVANIGLGFLAGYAWGPLGVAGAWSLVLASGGPAVFAIYRRHHPATETMTSTRLGSVIVIAVVAGVAILCLGAATVVVGAPLLDRLADHLLGSWAQLKWHKAL